MWLDSATPILHDSFPFNTTPPVYVTSVPVCTCVLIIISPCMVGLDACVCEYHWTTTGSIIALGHRTITELMMDGLGEWILQLLRYLVS